MSDFIARLGIEIATGGADAAKRELAGVEQQANRTAAAADKAKQSLSGMATSGRTSGAFGGLTSELRAAERAIGSFQQRAGASFGRELAGSVKGFGGNLARETTGEMRAAMRQTVEAGLREYETQFKTRFSPERLRSINSAFAKAQADSAQKAFNDFMRVGNGSSGDAARSAATFSDAFRRQEQAARSLGTALRTVDTGMARVAREAAAAAREASGISRAFGGMGGAAGGIAGIGDAFNGVSSKVRAATSAVNLFRAGLVGLTAAGITSALRGMAIEDDVTGDAFKRIQARTGSAGQARDLTGRAQDSADRLGAPVDALMGAIEALSRVAEKLGASPLGDQRNSQIQEFVETLTKAGVATGSTFREAAAAAQLLGLSLARSGKLTADMFDKLPEGAQAAIAKGFGRTAEQFSRHLAEGGSVSAREVAANLRVFGTRFAEEMFRDAKPNLNVKQLEEQLNQAWKEASRAISESLGGSGDLYKDAVARLTGELRTVADEVRSTGLSEALQGLAKRIAQTASELTGIGTSPAAGLEGEALDRAAAGRNAVQKAADFATGNEWEKANLERLLNENNKSGAAVWDKLNEWADKLDETLGLGRHAKALADAGAKIDQAGESVRTDLDRGGDAAARDLTGAAQGLGSTITRAGQGFGQPVTMSAQTFSQIIIAGARQAAAALASARPAGGGGGYGPVMTMPTMSYDGGGGSTSIDFSYGGGGSGYSSSGSGSGSVGWAPGGFGAGTDVSDWGQEFWGWGGGGDTATSPTSWASPYGFGFAEGGAIRGPGSATSDSIVARLSNGEFVVNARATSKHRALLEALNAGNLPGFAGGGLVGNSGLDSSWTGIGDVIRAAGQDFASSVSQAGDNLSEEIRDSIAQATLSAVESSISEFENERDRLVSDQERKVSDYLAAGPSPYERNPDLFYDPVNRRSYAEGLFGTETQQIKALNDQISVLEGIREAQRNLLRPTEEELAEIRKLLPGFDAIMSRLSASQQAAFTAAMQGIVQQQQIATGGGGSYGGGSYGGTNLLAGYTGGRPVDPRDGKSITYQPTAEEWARYDAQYQAYYGVAPTNSPETALQQYVNPNTGVRVFVNSTNTPSTAGQPTGSYTDRLLYGTGSYAAGGAVSGPGSGTSDSIPAWLSNGEFVVNSRATAKHRRLLEVINDGSARLPGFAEGGLVKDHSIGLTRASERVRLVTPAQAQAGTALQTVAAQTVHQGNNINNLIVQIKGSGNPAESMKKSYGDVSREMRRLARHSVGR